MTDAFQETMNLDPLLEAEKLTGSSYKEDPITEALGFVILQAKAKWLKDELSLRDDTYRSIPFLDARRIFADLGFVEVYEEQYEAHREPETFLMLWHPKGVLMKASSYTTSPEYGGVTLNGATLYGNWLPNSDADRWKFTSSGSFNRVTPGYEGDIPDDPWVWVGNWPGGEGLRNLMDRLDNNGTWLPEWRIQPMLHLDNFEVSHSEKRQKRDRNSTTWLDELRADTAARIALLPEHVQTAIKGLREE